MYEIFCQLNKGLLFSASVWEELRREYRIVGTFLGSTLKTPSLPVELLPEEIVLLVNKGICKLINLPDMQDIPEGSIKTEFESMQKKLMEAEQHLYKESRRDELESMIDQIIKGKQKKGVIVNQSPKEFLEEELNKCCTITETNLIWPIFTVPPLEYTTTDVPLSSILAQTTSIKCVVFKDLWEKHYYITSGVKFGGDFLVYLGDPVVHHAVYIVRCIENPDAKLHTSEIIAFGRLGSSVKKRAVLASLSLDGTVSYVTLNWLNT